MTEDGFWMVMADKPDRPAPRVRHHRVETAINEAKRLAAATPGEKFYVLAVCGVARKIDPVSYEFIETDSIPF